MIMINEGHGWWLVRATDCAFFVGIISTEKSSLKRTINEL